MTHLPVWKFTVTSGHPQMFKEEVVPAIEELNGSSTVTSEIGFEAQYWVKLPASILREELDSLIQDRNSNIESIKKIVNNTDIKNILNTCMTGYTMVNNKCKEYVYEDPKQFFLCILQGDYKANLM